MSTHTKNNVENTAVRAAIALIAPIAIAYAAKSLTQQSNNTLFFGIIGIVSWLLGLRWYGIKGMGLRGGRALFAGAGFAVLGWIAFLIARVVFIPIDSLSTGIKDYIFLLLFEAFAVQLWLYGLFFRAVAEWRGGLTAAVSSGIVFGGIGFLFFQESTQLPASMLYFVTLGMMYGIIRLRTGSIVGIVLVQAVQSFTGWVAFTATSIPITAEWNDFYMATSVAYLIISWRLWPKVEEDYRV